MVVGAFPADGVKIYGGIVTACRELAASSFPRRYDLTLIDTTQSSQSLPGILRRLWGAIPRTGRFIASLLQDRPDCVLLFAAPGSSLVEKGAMASLSRFLHVPALMFPRGAMLIQQYEQSPLSRIWIKWAFLGASKVLCQGGAWQRFAEGLGFTRRNAPLVPNWTATERMLAIGRQRCPRQGQSPFRLLFVGWLERWKGVFDLLEACARLAPMYSFVLTFAGNGDAYGEAREYAAAGGMADRVRFLGWTEGEALEDLYRESDVFVLPSWTEGLPNAMIEAMASGLAVVVSAVGTIPDVVTDGHDALVVPPKDVDALAGALRRVMDDPGLLDTLARNGHRLATEEFAVEPAVERLARVIDDVVAERRSGRRV